MIDSPNIEIKENEEYIVKNELFYFYLCKKYLLSKFHMCCGNEIISEKMFFNKIRGEDYVIVNDDKIVGVLLKNFKDEITKEKFI